jgi:hypothetical protein
MAGITVSNTRRASGRRTAAALGLTLFLCGCAPRQFVLPESLSGQTTIVGCLTAGSAPGEFVLTERSGATKTIVTGHPRLAMHADNHAVKIIGIYERESKGQGLKAIKIDHIAGSCFIPF